MCSNKYCSRKILYFLGGEGIEKPFSVPTVCAFLERIGARRPIAGAQSVRAEQKLEPLLPDDCALTLHSLKRAPTLYFLACGVCVRAMKSYRPRRGGSQRWVIGCAKCVAQYVETPFRQGLTQNPYFKY